MSALSGFLSLIKPTVSEFQDVDVINQNMDKIDNYLKASDGFVPLPLGASTSDSANFNTPFGLQAAYVDKIDHFVCRGVIAHTSTTNNYVSGDIIGRLPAAVAGVQYFTGVGTSDSRVSLQVNANGQITIKATPAVATYWVSIDNLTIWK